MTDKPKKKGYDFTEVEAKIKEFWEKEKIFKTQIKDNIYSIDTPPPTVSGKMHIGHAFSYAQQDFIARYRRMNGGVFYPFGTDDNGLPTERLVEKLKKVKSKNMSRTEFIKLCLKTIEEIRPDFINDWKNLGVSADYDKCYSTIDDESRKISQKGFLDLYKKGEIYKNKFPTLWCPECQTAIAQAELEDKERSTYLVYIKAKVEDGSFIIYATTRPELHPGCIGISINENGQYVKVKSNGESWIISKDALEKMKEEFDLELEEEFLGKDIIGKKVEIPYAEQTVEINHDISAKTEYGTGVVYYCSYGGLDCVQWLGRHPEAKPIHVMDESGSYTKGLFKGLKSPEAREKIIELLEKEGSLIKKEKMNHAVNTHDKCGTDIEFIATPQWFIKLMDKKDKLIKQGNKVKWYPEYMHKRYDNWVNGLEWDWNISRNRHFGIPIPAWECKDCNEIIIAEEKELPIDPLQTKKSCPKCGKEATPEVMVLDTWATSSMSPKIASNLVGDKVKLPYSLRPNAHDIIRTWAFYTITRAYLHENKIPWKDIVISGIVSLKGEKMSKSKGNVIDPKTVLENYGADALRFWASGSKLGSDLDYQEQDLVAGKKTATKFWNATKFVFMNLEDYDGKTKPKSRLETIDIIFLNKLNQLVQTCTESFEKYEYSKAKLEIEKFFWKDFCDNYLEIVKKRIYNSQGDEKISAQYSLYKSLLTITKLLSPIMPFITEETYQTYFKKIEKGKSIHTSSWPKAEGQIKEIPCHADFDSFSEVLSQIRQAKTAAQKAMNSEITLTLEKDIIKNLGETLKDLQEVTNAKEIKEGKFNVAFIN